MVSTSFGELVTLAVQLREAGIALLKRPTAFASGLHASQRRPAYSSSPLPVAGFDAATLPWRQINDGAGPVRLAPSGLRAMID